MIVVIILFFISIILAFGMLCFRVWEIRTGKIDTQNLDNQMPELSFRHIERYMLYWTKRIIQWIVLSVVKYWLITVNKVKNLVSSKWPKIHSLFKKKEQSTEPKKISFVRRAILESKTKIKKLKEKIREEQQEEKEESTTQI
jgi:hypothetical protein